MSIFIVDDSEIGREVIKKALFLYGYKEVLEAKDGVDALEKIKATDKKIDLFVFDINMPRMDGLTLLEEVKKVYPQIPVVMLTTETDKAKMVRAKEMGATGWIVKPFVADKFIKVVDMLVKK
jgi:two-component system, chemotaxis family, chemotaxis protein CheY